MQSLPISYEQEAQSQAWLPFNPESSYKNTSTLNSTQRLSVTETEIFSHDLVKQVMQASFNKTVSHQINSIDSATELYSRPILSKPKEFIFSQIPSEVPLYSSSCSTKIHQISNRLNHCQNIQQKMQSFQNKTNKNKNRPFSASTSEKKTPIVSVSGLVAYNFNSVAAKKSVGYGYVSHEEKMKKQIQNLRQKLYCSTQRRQKIVEKRSSTSGNKQRLMQKGILTKTAMDTERFLQFLHLEKEQSVNVYKCKQGDLVCIKDYMWDQNVGLEEAEFVVNAISKSQSKEPSKPPQLKHPRDQESELRNRRNPIRNSRVLLRHLFFTE